MGRFATTVDFYARYREPYPATFFKKVAERIGLRGNESLLDIACGPGPLAIGFAPYVGQCTGLDPEEAMIAAAKSSAAQAGVSLRLVHGRIEDFATERKFDVITIGRAIHWMERSRALQVLEQITADNGHILICGASSVAPMAGDVAATDAAPAADTGAATDGSATGTAQRMGLRSLTPAAPVGGSGPEAGRWVKLYDSARRAWAKDPKEKKHLGAKEWFEGSGFGELETILVSQERQATIAELIGRALSKSSTSLAILGERRAAFEAEITAVLEPFAEDGVLQEEIVARASVFGRRAR